MYKVATQTKLNVFDN